MKLVSNVVAVILVLLGVLWILQGTDVIRSGFMAGHMQWAILGVVVGVVGAALLVLTNRRGRRTPTAGGPANS